MIMLNATMKVEMALISGVMPMRTFDQMSSGSVVICGPEVKKVVMKSSNDSVKASSDAARMPGAMTGRVMRKNDADRSRAEVGAGLFERLVEALQTGPDDDHDEGDVPGDVRDEHGREAELEDAPEVEAQVVRRASCSSCTKKSSVDTPATISAMMILV